MAFVLSSPPSYAFFLLSTLLYFISIIIRFLFLTIPQPFVRLAGFFFAFSFSVSSWCFFSRAFFSHVFWRPSLVPSSFLSFSP
jgi:hypothetical protein